MLLRLTARGFKSLHELDLELPRLSVFVGPNAAGKSKPSGVATTFGVTGAQASGASNAAHSKHAMATLLGEASEISLLGSSDAAEFAPDLVDNADCPTAQRTCSSLNRFLSDLSSAAKLLALA